jgi:aminoglycoside phosphotransferase (APT) family kinase protein
LDWLAPFPPEQPTSEILAPRARGSGREGAPDSLLHLDLHPDNVILSPTGAVVIDWSSAKRGDVAAAVALTWVIIATSEIDGPPVERWVGMLLRRLFVRAFLRQVDRAAAARWLPAVAHHRLADRNLRPSERPAIHALLRRAAQSV